MSINLTLKFLFILEIIIDTKAAQQAMVTVAPAVTEVEVEVILRTYLLPTSGVVVLDEVTRVMVTKPTGDRARTSVETMIGRVRLQTQTQTQTQTHSILFQCHRPELNYYASYCKNYSIITKWKCFQLIQGNVSY